MKKIAIVGAGLSGLLTAYLISECSEVQVTIFEKGVPFEEREKSLTPDLLSGVGGAGTVFGGKFCLPPASAGIWKKTGYRNKDFSEFAQKCIVPFFKEDVLLQPRQLQDYMKIYEGLYVKNYESKFVSRKNMHKFVLELLYKVEVQGVKIKSNCEFQSVEKKGEGFLVTSKCDGIQLIQYFDNLILASGRYSSDAICKWLGKLVNVRLQNPDLGIRFTMDKLESTIFSQNGKDIKIKKKFGNIGVRTFCVCTGGGGALVDLKGMKYYDGHFDDKLTDAVNLGILARSPFIFGFEGAALFCLCLKKYIKADLSLKDYIKYSNRLIKETNMFDDILDSIKLFVLLLQQYGIIGENMDNYPVWLPSVDRLNPEIEINSFFETSCHNLYVIGDATGISRGFIQSMWSAYCVSKNIVSELEKSKVKMII